MEDYWKRLKYWINNHAPHMLQGLNAGAAHESIMQLEQLIGHNLPEDFKVFYGWHNGQRPESEGLIDTEELLSLTRIEEEWKKWQELLEGGDFVKDGTEVLSEPQQGIRDDWWNSLWIPITYDGMGNHYCLDLDPATEGIRGQVIRMWHDAPERELVASSFREWISGYIGAVEQGEYVYSEDWGGIVNIEDAREYDEFRTE